MNRFDRLINGCAAALTLFAASAPPTQAWPGYEYSVWQDTVGTPTLPHATPQSGQAGLAPLLTADDGSPITTRGEWETKRERILETWRGLFGTQQGLIRQPPLARELARHEAPGFTRIHLALEMDQTTTIPLYLFLPKPLPSEPLPAVIALHQTVAQGKDEPAGIKMTHDLNFADELAERGFITVAYDAIGFGERIPAGDEPYAGANDFFRAQPEWSYFGRMIWDFRQVVDYLETLSAIDAGRIGVIGHSHGSYGGLVGAAFEPRVKAVVSSCGLNTLRADPIPERWSALTPLMPRLGAYIGRIAEAPTDWHELTACIAPRPLFYYGTLDDAIFPNTAGLADTFEDIRGVYALYGEDAALRLTLDPGSHSFPPARQEEAYAWLANQLEFKLKTPPSAVASGE